MSILPNATALNFKDRLWVEKYRPKTLDQFLAQPVTKETFQKFIDEQNFPHLLLTGPAGTGKSTLARILINTIDCDSLIINASDENSVDTVRTKIKQFASTIGFNAFKVVLLEEADYLSKGAQAALRAQIEDASDNVRFIFTCNYIDKLIDPIISRMQVHNVNSADKIVVARHAFEILKNEGVQFTPEVLKPYIQTLYPDIRQIIGALQQHSTDVLRPLESFKPKTDALQTIPGILAGEGSKDDKYKQIRQILVNSKLNSYSELFRILYDSVEIYNSESIAQCIIAIAEYQYKESFVVDKEINASALIYQLLEYK